MPRHRSSVAIRGGAVFFALLLFALSVLRASAAPPARPPAGKVVIVVLHGVSWEELLAAKSPALQDLLRRAAVGAMNSRPLNAPDYGAPYVTIGAGRAAVATTSPGGIAAETGLADPKWLSRELADANLLAHTQAQVGLLGTILRRYGLRTGLLEVMGEPSAYAAGLRSPAATVVNAPGAPGLTAWGWAGDAGSLGLDSALTAADVLVIDEHNLLGVLQRRRSQAPAPSVGDPVGVKILTREASVFDEVRRLTDPARDLVIITSPTCPPYRRADQTSFAPIAVIGPGFGPGLLTSIGTRRRGIVANADIAPTILQHFGIPIPRAGAGRAAGGMSGHVMMSRRVEQPLAAVLQISRRGSRIYELQWRFGPVYAATQFIALIGAVLALLVAPAWAVRRRRSLQLVLLLALSLPLALIFLAPLDTGGVARPYLLTAALAAAMTWIAWYRSSSVTALGALLTATAGAVVVDALTGGHLMNAFMVNFGAMSASRFYGIGNETMGFLCASAAVGGAALLAAAGRSKAATTALALWFAVVTVVLGAPFWGANWGGGVTAAFTFAVTCAGLRAGRPRLRHWAVGVIAAAAAGALFVLLDVAGGAGHASHIRHSALLVHSGGAGAAVELATRKLMGNVRVLQWAPCLGIALAVCVVTVWSLLRPPARLRAILESAPALWAGLAGAAAGAVVTIPLNDSGLVAASTAIGIAACALTYFALTGGARRP